MAKLNICSLFCSPKIFSCPPPPSPHPLPSPPPKKKINDTGAATDRATTKCSFFHSWLSKYLTSQKTPFKKCFLEYQCFVTNSYVEKQDKTKQNRQLLFDLQKKGQDICFSFMYFTIKSLKGSLSAWLPLWVSVQIYSCIHTKCLIHL